jgi:anaerobic magnesium-protoporphyrin IX monomethyl ester cyclase
MEHDLHMKKTSNENSKPLTAGKCIGTRKAMAIYPPVGLYQRGEERCQADVESGSAMNLRAPNDLGYISAVLENLKISTLVRDYPAEKKGWEDFKKDLKDFAPEYLVISTTEATITKDIEAFKIAKNINKKIINIAKGAVFSAPGEILLPVIDFDCLDFAITGEAEFILPEIINTLSSGRNPGEVKGIIFKKGREIIMTPGRDFDGNLDLLPFPDRYAIKNKLYVRPDSGKPQATIQVSRGCPYGCIFCLTPNVSGSKIRYRSVANIIREIKDCVENHNIKDFFFRSDTFTANRKFVINLCSEIINSGLNISWVANSRTDTFDKEIAGWMKKAGCWLVAFGIESANDEILKKIGKNTTNHETLRVLEICKKNGLKTYCFFVIGFPWDTEETISDTFKLIVQSDIDYIEIHIATPYEGTELFRISKESGLIKESAIGHDYFSNPPAGTLSLSREQLLALRKKGLKMFYLRKGYIFKTLKKIDSPKEFFNYFKFGFKLLKNLSKK